MGDGSAFPEAALREDMVLSQPAYESLRTDLFPRLLALKSRRRVALGNWGTLAFECRTTAWFQVQEELRFFPDPQPHHVREILARIDPLVPRGDLRATLMFHGAGLLRRASRYREDLSVEIPGARLVAEWLDPSGEDGLLPPVSFLRFVPTGRPRGAPAVRWAALGVDVPLTAATTTSLPRCVSIPNPRFERTHP